MINRKKPRSLIINKVMKSKLKIKVYAKQISDKHMRKFDYTVVYKKSMGEVTLRLLNK